MRKIICLIFFIFFFINFISANNFTPLQEEVEQIWLEEGQSSNTSYKIAEGTFEGELDSEPKEEFKIDKRLVAAIFFTFLLFLIILSFIFIMLSYWRWEGV